MWHLLERRHLLGDALISMWIPKSAGVIWSPALIRGNMVCKFGSFKNPFAMITSLSSQKFILLVQMKKVISINYGNSKSSWKPWRWVNLELTFMMMDIYIIYNLNLLTKMTSSSRSTQFKGILPWNISQIITKTNPISTRIVISYVMGQGIPFWVW